MKTKHDLAPCFFLLLRPLDKSVIEFITRKTITRRTIIFYNVNLQIAHPSVKTLSNRHIYNMNVNNICFVDMIERFG